MDDNIILQPGKATAEDTASPSVPASETESDLESGSAAAEKIFDITPDLNIVQQDPYLESSGAPIPKKNLLDGSPGDQRTAPANPPAKTVGKTAAFSGRSMASVEDVPRQDLQSAISPILATSLREPAVKSPAELVPGEASIPQTSSSGHPSQMPPSSAVQMDNPNVRRLRTYEGDVAELLSHTHASAASIALAERKKTDGQESLADAAPTKSSHTGKNLILVIASLILVGGGVIAAYYLYSISPLAGTISATPVQQPTQKSTPSLIPADSQVVIRIDNQNAGSIQALVQTELAKPMSRNTIKEIVPVETVNGNLTRVSGPDMVKAINLNLPDILERSLTPSWILGEYSDQNGSKTIFVVATTDFFQNAFAGMLQWESLMPDDLKTYISPSTNDQFLAVHGQFQDRIIRNKDVREFVSTDGRALFLYSFIDNSRLVVAGSESALTEILSRLEKNAFVR
jgi:hypothetical protein